MDANKKVRALVLLPGPVPPPTNPKFNRFHYLSEIITGYILQPVWDFKDENGKQYRRYRVGEFEYLFTHSFHAPRVLKLFWDLAFFVGTGLYLYWFRDKYQIIITYGTTRTGFAGLLLKLLTGRRLLVEVPGVPSEQFLLEQREPSIGLRTKHTLSLLWTKLVVHLADHVKLLFSRQLADVAAFEPKKHSVFFDFVGISEMKPSDNDERFILFLGYPWYLKGVDLLIRAFNGIAEKFPDYALKIVGYCPNKSDFVRLIRAGVRTELLDACNYDEALRYISRCSFLVLPSRTESMGRVLIEAYALRKAVIGSDAGGIPEVIVDEVTGLIFPVGNVDALREALHRLLAEPSLRETIAQAGYVRAQSEYSEAAYVRAYQAMLRKINGLH